MKIKQRIKQVKDLRNTWTYNHKHLILTTSLLVVVLIQGYPIDLEIPSRAVAFEYIAGTPEETTASILEQQIENRSVAIYNENYEANMHEAKVTALLEAQEQLQELARLKPDETYLQLKQVVDAMQNTN